MLEASPERLVITFAHNDIHVAAVLVDQRLPQRREIRDGGRVSLPFLRWQQHRRLAGLQASPLPLQPHARGLSCCALQITQPSEI